MAIDYEKANTLKKLSTFQFQIFQTASICVRNVDGGDIVTRWRGRGFGGVRKVHETCARKEEKGMGKMMDEHERVCSRFMSRVLTYHR
ncbi:hypothetical protein ACSQ67_009915 [Phaseolus vulgaris]